jgi:hypothetical protein
VGEKKIKSAVASLPSNAVNAPVYLEPEKANNKLVQGNEKNQSSQEKCELTGLVCTVVQKIALNILTAHSHLSPQLFPKRNKESYVRVN